MKDRGDIIRYCPQIPVGSQGLRPSELLLAANMLTR